MEANECYTLPSGLKTDLGEPQRNCRNREKRDTSLHSDHSAKCQEKEEGKVKTFFSEGQSNVVFL